MSATNWLSAMGLWAATKRKSERVIPSIRYRRSGSVRIVRLYWCGADKMRCTSSLWASLFRPPHSHACVALGRGHGTCLLHGSRRVEPLVELGKAQHR
eukprot:scaffold32292_cov71-Phaeocystis_antarctica.AAC.4